MNERRPDEARRSILDAVRGHLAASAPFGLHQGAEPAAAAPRDFDLPPVERFRRALESVAGHCTVVPSEEAAADAVRSVLERRGARRVAVSDSPLALRVVALAKPDALVLESATAAELFDCDVGVTGAQWAVAETGTLVLDSERERHRLASLVPPVHVAVVEADRVRQTLGEVLHALGEGPPSRAVTFVTGPSRTSDIELTLAIGVHGPGELHVVIVEPEGRPADPESATASSP
jgi:L-lactate utilization protein LutC